MMLGLDTYAQARDVGAMANPTLHTLQPWSGVSVVPSGPVAMTTRPEYSYQQGWVPTMGFGYFSGNGIPELRRASLETRTYEPASSTTASEPEDGMGCRGVSPDAGTNTDMYNPPPVTPPPQRERFSYTRYQLEMLNGIFQRIRYPNSMQKQLVAKRVGITRDQVKIWFQNRRRKDIVGKKGKQPQQPDEEITPTSLMVPDTVMKGVISELLKYEKDPSGRLQKSSENAKSNTGTTPMIADMRERTSRSPQSEADSTTMATALMVAPNAEPYFLTPDAGLGVVSGTSRIGFDTQAVFPPRSPSVVSVASTDDSRRLLNEVPTAAQLDMVAPPNVTAPPSKPRPFMTTHGASRSNAKRTSKRTIDETLDTTTQNCIPITPPDFYPPNKVATSRQPIRFNGVSPVLPLTINIPGLSSTSPSATSSCTSGENDSQTMASSQTGFAHHQMEGFSHQYSEGHTYAQCSLPKQPSVQDMLLCRNNELAGYAAAPMQFHAAPNQFKQYPTDRGYPFQALVPDQTVMFHSMYQDPHAAKFGPPGVYRDAYQPFTISSFCSPYYGYDPAMLAAQLNDKTYMQL